MTDSPARTRLVQGAILVVGALLVQLVVDAQGSRFYLLPAALGLTYLGAALAGGPRGGYWATALVLLGWGAAVIVVSEVNPQLATAGLYLLGVGLAAVIGALLARRGFAVDPLGVAGTIALSGAALAFSPKLGALEDATTYAVLVGLVGAVNVARGATGR